MIKTLTFAVCHFAVAFSVAYLLTGSFGVASALALVEPLVNTVAYYFHEKVWERIRREKTGSARSPATHRSLFHAH